MKTKARLCFHSLVLSDATLVAIGKAFTFPEGKVMQNRYVDTF